MSTVIPAPFPTILPVSESQKGFPVRRVYCVGRNYAAHAVEMGHDPNREAPFFFQKNPDNLDPSGEFPYPPLSSDVHHEVELAVVLKSGKRSIPAASALEHVYGYAVALDMTRRDLQIASRSKQRPWDLGKDVESSAVFSPLTPAAEMGEIGAQRIHLEVNGEVKQDATLEELIWKLDEIVMDLSKFYHLRPGDLIMTGTPAGVGPVVAGDKITGGIDGLDPIALTITDAE